MLTIGRGYVAGSLEKLVLLGAVMWALATCVRTVLARPRRPVATGPVIVREPAVTAPGPAA
jgi:hypothetical protein